MSPALETWAAKGIVDRVPGAGSLAAAQGFLKDAGFVMVGGKLHYPAGVKETTTPYN